MHGELENGLSASLPSLDQGRHVNDYMPVREQGDKRSRRRNYWRICILMELPTYQPVPCGPRHNSSALLATVHAEEKENDACENV